MLRLEFVLSFGVATGATLCGFYACILWNRGLRVKQQEIYLQFIQTSVRALNLYLNRR